MNNQELKVFLWFMKSLVVEYTFWLIEYLVLKPEGFVFIEHYIIYKFKIVYNFIFRSVHNFNIIIC